MNNEVLEEKNGLTFSDLLYIVRKHLIVIIIAIVVFTIAGFGFGKYKNATSPEYVARGSMMVSVEQVDNTSNYQQYQISQYLKDTFVVFVTKDVVMQEASKRILEQYKVNISPKALKNSFTIELSGDSLIMDLTYTSKDAKQSVAVLNVIMDSAVAVANETNENGNAKYKFLSENIVILDAANENNVSKASNTVKYTIIFFALGAVVAFLYVLIRELTNNKFKDTEEVERLLGVPVLAGVPDYEFPEDK